MKWVTQLGIVALILSNLIVAGVARGQTFSDLRQAYEAAVQSEQPTASADAALVAWLQQCNIESLTDIDEVTWLCRWMAPRGIASNKFSVRWTGMLEAPVEGAYTLSACPIHVNVSGGGYLMRQTMAAWVGNQQVLDTTKGDWTYKGTPVNLQAGTKKPIRVEFSYESIGERADEQPAIAMLFWEGPGLAKEIVPPTALTTASGANGLDAQYRLTVGGQQQVLQQVEPKIDHFWMEEDPVVPADGQLRQRLAARLAALVIDPAYLDSCASGQRELVIDEVRLLDSPERRALVEAVLARPGLMRRVQPLAFSKLYGFCRAAAPDGTLDLIGRLTQGYPDGNPDIKRDLERQGYWGFGKLAWQEPEQFARLEQQYLVVPDGRCSLGVAYVLAYGYAGENRLGEWIEKIQARLAEPSLTGDQRVNWLMARAMSEELQGGSSGRTYFGREPYLAGRKWLEEACLVAQSESVRLRAYEQLTVRLAATEDTEGATKVLDQAAAKFTDPSSTAALAVWRTQLAAIAGQFRQQHAQDEAAAKAAYIQTLQSRRQQAIDQGNDQAAAQYEQKLKDAGAEVK